MKWLIYRNLFIYEIELDCVYFNMCLKGYPVAFETLPAPMQYDKILIIWFLQHFCVACEA